MYPPSPHGLDLVIEFVNTIDIDAGTDQLQDARAVTAWLKDHELLPSGHARLDEGEREQAIELREALRALMLANNGQTASGMGARELELAARRGELGVHFDATSARLAAGAGGAAGALASLLVPVALAMGDSSWARAKACRAEDCAWAFYDRSRNRSGVWCEMAVCGNRTKVRAYRRRGAVERAGR
jgi:predicted RNA-binding Zn ribbon-like protein